MAVGPFSNRVRECRVELVETCSRHVASLLDLLYNVGAVTEEDVSLVTGGSGAGERDRMRTLLDVLYGRGEEACRAFYHMLQSTETQTGSVDVSGQQNLQEHLQKHKDILGKEHETIDYLSIRSSRSGGCSFIDITLSKHRGCTFPFPYQHESAMVGDAFRGLTVRQESCGHDQTCAFRELCQTLLSGSSSGPIMLSGVAGSGKTTLVRRLVQEWASQADSQKVVLSLSFRELNLINEPVSLQELLTVHYSHLKTILSDILAHKTQDVLLILDGLDEFGFPLDFERTPKCSDPERVQTVGAMVVNLIKGSLLPGISILLTARPHAVSKVPPQLVNLSCSVLGFSPAQQRQYFEQNCGSPQAAEKVWGFVSSHKPLMLMCHIPAFCWIVSTALQDGTLCLKKGSAAKNQDASTLGMRGDASKEAKNAHIPSITITDIYCCFIKTIMVFHAEGREEGSHFNRLQDSPRVLEEAYPVLRDLGALAFKGLLERRFLFDSSDLGDLSQDSAGLSRVFLVEILKENRALLTVEKSFYFLHTSVQEYLAALYFVLQLLSGSNPFSGPKHRTLRFPPGLHKVFSSAARKLHGPSRLLRHRVKKALLWSQRHQSGYMDLFCRFVSGLLVPQTRFILQGLFPREPRNPCVLSPTPPFLLDLLHSQLESSSLCPERQVNLCHCLYEAKDPGLTKRLQGWLSVLAQRSQSEPSSVFQRDWSELAFLLQLNPDVSILKLDSQHLDAEGLCRLLPVLPLFCTLSLAQNPLGPAGAAMLSVALQSPDCRIESLWLVKTELGCEGVRILAEALKENSTVVDLRMAINQIGDVGAGCLADLLKANRTLKDIRLRDNQMTDRGADLLMTALHENTTLQCLWLFDNKFSKDGVRKLKEFSKRRSHLDIKVCV
ncbi:NLR family CARD domain-containing protein 3 [Denticeps clupeoides]|uniref:Uncharacterized protein n=1 Tax=Denticeps clupeoides TaxID=299321 RepID=A0AAY4EQD8_9TELE|nr:NLR family CARD domain-containing protein 3-like [Denticeps clupeoides]